MAYNIVEKGNFIEQNDFLGNKFSEYFVILGMANEDNCNLLCITRPMKEKRHIYFTKNT